MELLWMWLRKSHISFFWSEALGHVSYVYFCIFKPENSSPIKECLSLWVLYFDIERYNSFFNTYWIKY